MSGDQVIEKPTSSSFIAKDAKDEAPKLPQINADEREIRKKNFRSVRKTATSLSQKWERFVWVSGFSSVGEPWGRCSI